MVIRYLSGHAAREYSSGKRVICGVQMVEGLKKMINFQNQLLLLQPKQIMENTMLIFREAILSNGIVSEEDYLVLEKYTRASKRNGDSC
jgi:phosphoribosylaminoimidazole-succinocarboxamide synthase